VGFKLFRLIYWTDWGPRGRSVSPSAPTGPVIGRANLDGTESVFILNAIGRTTSLTIDFASDRLYWLNKDTKYIQSSDLTGKYSVP